jgi:hypothetical protein
LQVSNRKRWLPIRCVSNLAGLDTEPFENRWFRSALEDQEGPLVRIT